MRYRYYTADVFTDALFGGNQLAVFPSAAGLDTELMQRIAREFNFSETVFVFEPNDPANTRSVRIFTPMEELPFAGHPTIGTAFVLAAIGEIGLTGETTRIILEEGVGPVAVSIFAAGGVPTGARLTTARLPEAGPEPPPVTDLAAAISLDPADILVGEDRPRAFSCGVPYLCIELRHSAALRRVRINGDRWRSVFGNYWAPSAYLFTRNSDVNPGRLHARMFAPSLGVEEDPATGSAAAALAGCLAGFVDYQNGIHRWQIDQGVEMGRPSLLEVEVEIVGGAIAAVRVAGSAVLVCEGTMDLKGIAPA